MKKIAFVGNFQFNCGSSNTLLGYVKAGRVLGYDIRASEFGCIDNIIRTAVPVAGKDWKADLLVIVYESYPFLSETDIDLICKIVPRKNRILIDPDGKYLKPSYCGDDTNLPAADSYGFWTSLYDSLSDVILQPFLGSDFLYFGIDSQVSDLSRLNKNFDLIYVGNNWYRWNDMSALITAVSPIRTKLKRIALIGRYWSGDQMQGFENATGSDPDFLKKNHVEVYKSAPYGQVEKTMSRGKMHPILIRPILNEMGFVTPRMFETFAADTVPLIPNYFRRANELYGDEVFHLTVSQDPAAKILEILENYPKYRDISLKIAKKLRRKHSYEVRIRQLLDLV